MDRLGSGDSASTASDSSLVAAGTPQNLNALSPERDENADLGRQSGSVDAKKRRPHAGRPKQRGGDRSSATNNDSRTKPSFSAGKQTPQRVNGSGNDADYLAQNGHSALANDPTDQESAGHAPRSDDSQAQKFDADQSETQSLEPEELIRRHQRGVWRYLRMLGCDDATADDLTQETFLRVLRHDDFVQHNDNATAGYLRRTAYNLLVSRHRKLGRVQTISEPELLDECWDRWAGKDITGDAAVEALQQCFDKLTERARIALRMRFDSDATRVEIGEALGITDHGARNLMQRAKAQLRSCVEEKLKLSTEI